MEGSDREDIHVVPNGDLHDHELEVSCPCVVRTEYEGATPMIIHTSWDGREAYEDNSVGYKRQVH